jgi:hypothetical protein
MKFRNQRPDALIIFLCFAWIVILGGLGLSAIIFESISITTKTGVSHSEGLGAAIQGSLLIGFALIGVLPFLATNAYKRHVCAALFSAWLAGSVIYLIYR